MKMVRAGVVNGESRLEWREGWDPEHNCWQESAGDPDEGWIEARVGEGIGIHIMRLLRAFFNSPSSARLFGDEQKPPGLLLCWGQVGTIIVKELPVEHLTHWHMILTEVAHQTHDGELQQFALEVHRGAGTLQNVTRTKKKAAEQHGKGVATKEKIKLRKPWPRHIIAGYLDAKKKHAAREHGDSPIELFWKDVIEYTDECRLNDLSIKFEGDDKLFNKEGDEIDVLPWDIGWKRARNVIGDLKKAGLIK